MISSHFGGGHIVQYYFSCYDPLQYPLSFPFGDSEIRISILVTVFSIDPQQSNNPAELLRKEERGRLGLFFVL